jgi:hypothetical protein
MPRYFFDLCDGNGLLTDGEGLEFADMYAMRTEALSSVRSLLASDIVAGVGVNLAHFLAVRDESGREVHRVPFRDALTVLDVPCER